MVNPSENINLLDVIENRVIMPDGNSISGISFLELEVSSDELLPSLIINVIPNKVDIKGDATIKLLEWSEKDERFEFRGKEKQTKVHIYNDSFNASKRVPSSAGYIIEDIDNDEVIGACQRVRIEQTSTSKWIEIEQIDLSSCPEERK